MIRKNEDIWFKILINFSLLNCTQLVPTFASFSMKLSLGIDIGTTSVAAVVIGRSSNERLFALSKNHEAGILLSDGIFEQDSHKVFSTLISIISDIPSDIKEKITSIGVTGQMHGVILFNNQKSSNLVTWQDKRASKSGKLSEINQINGCEHLKDGFAFTTLYMIKDQFPDYEHCGTIQDYFVWLLTGKPERVSIDFTDAASWGIYNLNTNIWDDDAISKLGIPKGILPQIVPCGTKVGVLSDEWANKLGLTSKIPVTAAIGDNQASIIGSSDDGLILTIGTGNQLSVVLEREVAFSLEPKPTYELRPFINNKLLAVSAPLSGGSSWKFLVDSIRMWIKELDLTPDWTDDIVYEKIDNLALKSIEKNNLPVFDPSILGERWDINKRGHVSNINLDNFSLSEISASLAIGIMRNLKGNLPESVVTSQTKLIANGNAVHKSKALQKAIEIIFGIKPTLMNSQEEAATGAAILGIDYSQNNN